MTTKIEETPKRLYKFAPVNINTSDIFCQKILWFSRPDGFNDPYDCDPELVTDTDEEGFLKYLMLSRRDLHQDWPENKLTEEVDKEYKKSWPLIDKAIGRFKDEYKKHLSSVGVFSMSKTYKNVVLWSHYADQHKGICLELDPSVMTELGFSFIKIEYVRRRPVFNLFKDYKSVKVKAVTQKAFYWNYEHEWRLVFVCKPNTRPFPQKVNMPEGFVKGVILGTKIKEADRDRVIDWCNLLPNPLQLFDAVLDKVRFKINRVAIE